MTRERAIELIGSMKGDLCDFYDDDDLTALEMAIASLKTDEAYQLEYENRDFVEIPEGMTNGEVFQSIFPCDEVHINGLQEGMVHFSMKSNPTSMDCFGLDWWNAPYKKGGE